MVIRRLPNLNSSQSKQITLLPLHDRGSSFLGNAQYEQAEVKNGVLMWAACVHAGTLHANSGTSVLSQTDRQPGLADL
jgi:ATP-dependent Clp protease adapter protein ClpS